MSINRRLGVPMANAYEQDALSIRPSLLKLRPGDRKAAKKAFNRRLRRQPVECDDDRGDDG
ncbi:MAG: hypothetical protein JWP50_1991 [Phenylobacterium sp.]|nr:hypothetical protein [Phenylobacterium sp.]